MSQDTAMQARGRRLFSAVTRVVAWAIVPLYAAGMFVTSWVENLLGIPGESGYLEDAAIVVGFGALAVVGALLVAKHPANSIGWILTVVALMFALFPAADMYAAYVIATRGSPDLLSVFAAWVQGWYWLLSLALVLVYLPLLFPDGRLPSHRWLPVAVLTGIAVAVAVVLGALSDTLPLQSTGYRIENPIGIEGLANIEELPVFVPLTLVFALAIVSAFASVVVRFRRARGIERQQLKWFVFGASPLLLFPVVDFLPQVFGDLTLGAVLLGMPTAIGIAILRHRLYDIDVVINRTLVYAALTATLILIYLGGVATSQYALRALTGQEQQTQLAIVASTLVIAALFNPLRKRIQSFIDRRFYRRKYDATHILKQFSTKLRDETNLGALSDEVAAVVRETVQPEHVSVWLRPDATRKGSEVRGPAR